MAVADAFRKIHAAVEALGLDETDRDMALAYVLGMNTGACARASGLDLPRGVHCVSLGLIRAASMANGGAGVEEIFQLLDTADRMTSTEQLTH